MTEKPVIASQLKMIDENKDSDKNGCDSKNVNFSYWCYLLYLSVIILFRLFY